MSSPLSEREVQNLFDQLERMNEKLDGIATLAQKAETDTAWMKGEVVRLDRQHRDMHTDVFGDKGLSSRVRQGEHTLAHHKVIIGIITALAIAATVAVTNRELSARTTATAR